MNAHLMLDKEHGRVVRRIMEHVDDSSMAKEK